MRCKPAQDRFAYSLARLMAAALLLDEAQWDFQVERRSPRLRRRATLVRQPPDAASREGPRLAGRKHSAGP